MADDEILDCFAGLKPNEILFVKTYCGEANSNGALAARISGYGTNPDTCATRAWQLLKRDDIQAAIRAWLRPRILSGERILDLLSKQGETDATQFESCYKTVVIEDPDTGKTIAQRRIDWDRVRELGLGKLVRSVKQTKFGESIEFHDPQRALELVGKFHSLFADRLKVETVGDDLSTLSDDQLKALAKGEAPKV
jgi:hypothetical protein